MLRSMKSKTSVTLSRALLEELARVTGKNGNRSRLIETAVQEYLHKLVRDESYKRELELLNRQAAKLNKEAKDVLTYQVKL